MGKGLDISRFELKAKALYPENRLLVKKLGKMDARKLDDRVHELHDEVFASTDCLECANCCRTLGPRITEKDVDRIAKALKIRPSVLLEKLLKRDEDEDLVFRKMPCPFLLEDNACSIYEDRPRACREYPHTDRKKFRQLLPITLQNSMVCPAVLEILERMKAGF